MSNRIVRLTIIDKREHLLNFKLEYINTKLFFTCTANNTETSLLKKTVLARGDLEGLSETNLYHLSTLG